MSPWSLGDHGGNLSLVHNIILLCEPVIERSAMRQAAVARPEALVDLARKVGDARCGGAGDMTVIIHQAF